MRKYLKIVLITFSSLLLLSCNNSNKSSEYALDTISISSDEIQPVETRGHFKEYAPSAEVSGRVSESSSRMSDMKHQVSDSRYSPMAMMNTKSTLTVYDGNRRFIRTANLKMKVKNVPNATYAIEDIIIKNKGFIIRSNVNKSKWNESSIQVSSDSVSVITINELTGDLSLRVSQELLDATLREIGAVADDIDHRVITAQDMSFDLLLKKLTKTRLMNKSKRTSSLIDTRSGKLSDAIMADNTLDAALKAADDTEIENQQIYDRIEFSTITISLYQDPFETKSMEAIKKVESDYTTKLWPQIVDALYDGWLILKEIFVAVINMWPIVLIAAVVIFFVRRYRKRRKANKG